MLFGSLFVVRQDTDKSIMKSKSELVLSVYLRAKYISFGKMTFIENVLKDTRMTMPKRKKKRSARVPAKEMVMATNWFKEYWLVLAIMLAAVAAVVAYYYWFVSTLPQYP